MKKIFGISLGALFAAVPMMAGAANIDLSANGHGNIEAGDQNKAVSVSYVKGAYNELGTAINTKQDQLKNGETNISSAVSSEVRATESADNATLVTELAVRNAIVSAITSAGDAATTKINALDSTVTQAAASDTLAVTITEEDGKLTSVSATIASGTVTKDALSEAVQSSLNKADAAATATALAAETTARETADSALGGRIDALESAGYITKDVNDLTNYTTTTDLQSAYATKTGVEKTINNVSYTANLNNTAVTGSVTAMSEWGSSATSAIAMTGSVTNSAVTVTRSGNASYTAQ